MLAALCTLSPQPSAGGEDMSFDTPFPLQVTT